MKLNRRAEHDLLVVSGWRVSIRPSECAPCVLESAFELCGALLRPPLSHERLRYLPSKAGGAVILKLKKPWQDRTTHIEMTPNTFITRLASLVPRPRKNTSIYFGVLAGHAKGRKKIVPTSKQKTARREDATWAALMKHSFGLDVLGCPKCKARLRLVAVILDRSEVKRLLQHLKIWSDPIPVRRARDPPELFEEAYDYD